MESYRVTLTGTRPLLMHNNSIDFRDVMKNWMKDPANKKMSVAGDDRSPPWTWLGYCYHDGEHLVMPSDNLMTMIREGAAKVPTGKRQETFKRISQAGILVMDLAWDVIPVGRKSPVDWKPIEAAVMIGTYEQGEEVARENGFALYKKNVKVQRSSHIRVRPRFEAGWQISGEVTTLDERITRETLQTILEMAGRYAGLGDWRPSSPMSPGPFGMFEAVVE